MRNVETKIFNPNWNPKESCSSIKRPNFFSGLLVIYNFLIYVGTTQISVILCMGFFPPLEEASAIHDSNRSKADVPHTSI